MNAQLFRKFLFFKMPIGWLAGMRLKTYNQEKSEIAIKLHRLSQNPFKSIFWAVQGMAAEASTAIPIMNLIKESGLRVSMLVTEQNGKFLKKAVGRVVFVCNDVQKVDKVFNEAIETKEGRTIKLYSTGYDEEGDVVAEFWFDWSFKVKS